MKIHYLPLLLLPLSVCAEDKKKNNLGKQAINTVGSAAAGIYIAADKMMTSSPFKSTSELKKMSQRSPIKCLDAVERAINYAMKEKPSCLRMLSLNVLSYKQGEYANYYYFPIRTFNKLDTIKGRYLPTGIYVNAQTGEARYIEREGASEVSKIDTDDYEDIYGVKPSKHTFECYLRAPSEEFKRAHAVLEGYLKKESPEAISSFNICYKKGARYYFPLQERRGPVMAGFEVDLTTGQVEFILRPLASYYVS